MNYRRLLRLAAVPVTDRRWAAPLSALALGLGLFVGVALGPGASGTLATGASPILVEVPGLGGDPGAGRVVAGTVAPEPSAATTPRTPEAPAPVPAQISSTFSGPPAAEPTAPPQPSPPAPEPAPVPAPEEEEGGEGGEEAVNLAGAVVHINPAAGSYVLAEAGGGLLAVHSGRLPAPGAQIEVPGRPLANGTYAEAGTRVRTGSERGATLSGIVTFVDPTAGAPTYVVSKRGASLLVRVPADPGAPPPQLPALGAAVEVGVTIGEPPIAPAPVGGEAPVTPDSAEAVPPCAPDPSFLAAEAPAPRFALWQRRLKAGGTPFTYGDFEGILTALCPQTDQLAISADDTREGLRDLVFTVPVEIDTTGLEPGSSVAATATIGADGSLTLTGLASDERTKGADDASATRGDLAVDGAGR